MIRNTTPRTRSGGTPRTHTSGPRWKPTRRVAYDVEEDDDELPVQSVKPVSNSQTQCNIEPLVKSSQDVAQDRPKSDQEKFRADKGWQGVSTSQRVSEARQRRSQRKALEVPGSLSKPDTATNMSNDIPNPDDWIICKPYEETKRRGRGWNRGLHNTPDGAGKPTRANGKPKGSIGNYPKPSRKPKTKFTDLPPEIRNTIYAYAVPECTVLIARRRPKKEARGFENYWSEEHITHRPRQSRLVYQPDDYHTSEELGGVIDLMLTCKQIKTEVETFFYSRIQFCFYALKSLRTFLHDAPDSGIRAIRSVYIQQDGYGNAGATVDQKYREKYYQKWEETCARLGQKASNLEHLKLKVYDTEWPCVLSGKEYSPAWGEAILMSAPALLPKVEIRVYHNMIDCNQAVLKDLGRRVEDSMMTEAGRMERDRIETEIVLAQIAARKAAKEKREQRRPAKLNAPPAPTELVISIDDIQKQATMASAANKVRSKGLDKFSKLDLSTYGFPVVTFE